MLSTCFFILFISLLWHFMYEEIIAPTLRLSLKFNYDKLEDELFMLKINHPDELNFNVFKLIEGEILDGKESIKNLNIVSARRMYKKAKEITKIEELIKRRKDLINSCKLPEIKKIERNIIINFTKTIAINSGGWSIYLLPFAILAIAFCSILLGLYKIIKSISDIKISVRRKYINYKESINEDIMFLIRSSDNDILRLNNFNEIINSKLHQHC